MFPLDVSKPSSSFILPLLETDEYVVEFDHNGRAVQNEGICDVEQWAELVHDIVGTSAPGVGHRYIVERFACKADAFLGAHPEGFCCNQMTSKVVYTFKK